MTNENERGSQENSLHERLCAYVLGEGTSEERLEIERELLRSPALRAQCDTIERTVGLVRDALGKGETLSPEAADTLYSAASASRPSAWKLSGFLRLAAGLGAVALGFAIVREAQVRPESEVARLDDDARADRSARGFLDKKPDAETAQPVDAAAAVPSGREAPELAKTKNAAAEPAPITLGAVPEADAIRALSKSSAEAGSAIGVGTSKKEQARNEADKLALVEEVLNRQRDFDAGLKETALDGSTVQPRQQVDPSISGYGLTTTDSVEAKLAQANPGARAGDLGYAGLPAAGGGGAPLGPSGPATGAPVVPSVKPGASVAPFARRDSLAGRAGAPSSPAPTGPAEKSKADRKSRGAGEATPQQTAGGTVELLAFEERDASAPTREFELHGLDEGRTGVPYYKLPPAEQQIYLENECRKILTGCVRRPNEKPRDMYFRFFGDNPFEVTALDALSTFAADVDTASYALARRYIREGNVPEKAQIRTEEFVNYFKSDVPAPTSGVFAIHTDLAPSRYSTDTSRQMLRVVVRGKDLSKIERPRMNLTFVVDVSGSMREQMRLEMVKTAIRLLVTQLDPYDKIGIVKFSTDASVVLPLTNVSDRVTIETAIAPLAPDGSTNSNAGLELGYGMALGGLDKEAINRVVFLSDGVANVGETDPAKIAERVKPMREKGIYLNTIGVGMNNHNDVLLEQLADKADGMCTYIDTADEAKKQLVDNFSGAFQPIARDVKIQVEFDPTQVLRYRLLGYENRAIADADFRNDKVDAGELGAGHQVTALYEIERQGSPNPEKPMATVRLRWKEPRNFGLNAESDAATEITRAVAGGPASTFEGAGQSYRKAVMAAQFAEILRRSVHARGDSLDALLNDAVKLQAEIPGDKDFTEFVTLVSQSKDLILRTMPACDELCQAIDQVRENQYRRAQIEQMQRDLDQKTLDELKRQNDELEARLRDLVRRRLENHVR